jgi:hypothetical protein
MGVQKHYKKRFAKQSCPKVFTKQIDKKSKPLTLTLSRFLFYHVLGRFTARGVQKHHSYNKTSGGENLIRQSCSFFGLLPTNPPRGSPIFFAALLIDNL